MLDCKLPLILQQGRLDKIDLQIMRLLARDSRAHNTASAVGITPSAAKNRINKMISNGVIRNFTVMINPVIMGYEKECLLVVKKIGKTTNEQDMFEKISLLGDVCLNIKHLE